MFNVFLHICREDNVGTDADRVEFKIVHEIHKRTAKLCIEYRAKVGNHIMMGNPDKLYWKFIGTVTSLPEDATV